MIKCKIIFYSKNKKSLIVISNCLTRLIKTKNLKITKKKILKKKLSVLKSPHINKSAQEQFGYYVYKTEISCYVLNLKKYLTFLKRLKNPLFPNVRTKLVGYTKTEKTYISSLLSSNNFCFHFKTFKNLRQKKNIIVNDESFKTRFKLKKTLSNLKILDFLGSFKSV